MFKWLFKKKGCAKHMNNKLEVIGIDHGWSMMKTISQVFVTGVKILPRLKIQKRRMIRKITGPLIMKLLQGRKKSQSRMTSRNRKLQ